MDLPVTAPTLTQRDVRVLHLEPTDRCQASCALCARETDSTFDKTLRHDLDMHKIMQVFDANSIANLEKMFMCGVYGDPAAGQHSLDIYRAFRQLNPDIVLGMNTNGALRAPNWWRELAAILNQPRDYVVFSIDGLADTNTVYRRGVDWHKLMANAQAFIDSGGSAHWDMLVYQHNEHQVNECEQLARNMGFSWFRAKVSRRGFTKILQAPQGWQLPVTQNGVIQCHALQEHSAYIDAWGTLRPCCWLTQGTVDFDAIQHSWHSNQPNTVCQATCGTQQHRTAFAQQWQREVELA
jgi:sulfatase maturation enzyme AslB (radical SAM superfamily)